MLVSTQQSGAETEQKQSNIKIRAGAEQEQSNTKALRIYVQSTGQDLE